MIRLYLALALLAIVFGAIYTYQDTALLREVARGSHVEIP